MSWRSELTRDEAKARGLIEYQPDHPCGNGHQSKRLVSNDRCRQCQKEWMPRFAKCAINACDGNAHWTAGGSRGHCRPHRLRRDRYGDPLAGGPYRGEELDWLMQRASYPEKDACLVYPYGDEGSLGGLTYGGKKYKAPRLMCLLAHGEPPSDIHEAAHSCGKRHLGCVNPNHLRWALPAENAADKASHGTHRRGASQNGAKLTEDDVRKIRRLIGVIPHQEIADRFDVSQPTISQIKHGSSWGWLDSYAYPDPLDGTYQSLNLTPSFECVEIAE